jgi:uncharacterized protein YndB with AHSA1/START domain
MLLSGSPAGEILDSFSQVFGVFTVTAMCRPRPTAPQRRLRGGVVHRCRNVLGGYLWHRSTATSARIASEGAGLVRVTMSIEIDAPPEVVWPFLVEPAKTRAWFAAADTRGMGWAVSAETFEWTSEPGGVGSTFHWFDENGDPTLNIDFETTEWDPPYVFGFRMTAGEVYRSYDERWVIEETATGSRFTFNDRVEFARGPIGKLIGLFAARTARKTGRAILANLKHLAEADAAARGDG